MKQQRPLTSADVGKPVRILSKRGRSRGMRGMLMGVCPNGRTLLVKPAGHKHPVYFLPTQIRLWKGAPLP
jgi:hypothetical protein